MNILILSAGRRVELVQCFQNAKKELGIEGKIIGGDASSLAPALQFCDIKEQLPYTREDCYIDKLIKVIQKHDVQAVVPTIDTELLILAVNKNKIETETNAKVLVSSIELIEYCGDKYKSLEFFENKGLRYPKLIKNFENATFPVFIKPKDGSSSINAFKVNNKKELEFFSEYIKNPITQEYIAGVEYTVDVLFGFDSEILSIVPRIRKQVRGGEVLQGCIEKNLEIIEEIKNTFKDSEFIGQITFQLIRSEDANYYIEINPRFGGGAPMSIKAGADSCKKIYKMLRGDMVEYDDNYADNVYFSRYDQSVEIK